MEKNLKKNVYIYIYMNHFAVHQKLTHYKINYFKKQTKIFHLGS